MLGSARLTLIKGVIGKIPFLSKINLDQRVFGKIPFLRLTLIKGFLGKYHFWGGIYVWLLLQSHKFTLAMQLHKVDSLQKSSVPSLQQVWQRSLAILPVIPFCGRTPSKKALHQYVVLPQATTIVVNTKDIAHRHLSHRTETSPYTPLKSLIQSNLSA